MTTGAESILQFRILVVDDEESLRGMLTELLTECGYVVATAASGEAALEQIRQSEFHVILTDIRMEKMSGIDLIRHVRAMQSETEVVIMTSHASTETAIEALRLGAYDYIIKPFENLDQVLTLVRRTLDKVRLVVENRMLLADLRRKNEELEQLNRAIRELAVRDGLTGLYNYRYFQEMLRAETARSERHNRPASVLMIDVDNFKTYNDTHGHVMGDEVLRALARILGERARRTDMVARYGGEEFVILLPETSREAAQTVAESLLERVANHPFPKGDTQPLGRVTISVGLAEFPRDASDARGLIENADKALYRSKSEGRNRCSVFQKDDPS